MFKKHDTTERDFSYGLLKYSSINIGDEIQSVAAMRFLPQIDEYVHRERIDQFVPELGKKTKLFMNAWWMWEPEHFPPSEYIDPCLISMYVRDDMRERFLTPQTKDYLIKHGPVGCRDMATANWLKENDVPAYFSGCLTLTLQRNWKVRREDYILCVDIPKEVVDEIRKRTKKKVYLISRNLSPFYTSKQRLSVAKLYLRLYHNAFCVVSSRLHVILPCLAFETPVLRIVTGEHEMDVAGRFSGYEDFVHTATAEDILSGKKVYNFNHPPRNPNKHKKLRDELIKKCKTFTGYDRKRSFILHHQEPLLELFKLNKYSYSQVKRLLYWAKNEDLQEVLDNKNAGITKHDAVF